MNLITNLQLAADEFDHEFEFDFACTLKSFHFFSDFMNLQLDADEFDHECEFDFASHKNQSISSLVNLIMNLQLDADEFDHESEFDFT